MKYGESAFDIIYLVFAVVIGICILRKRRDIIGRLMGCAVLILGFGDAFHLVPRVLNYFIVADFTPWLGVGKLITSITMTIFYLLMYFLWLKVYGKSENKGLSITIYILVAIRIILCLLPQNGWLTGGSDYIWGIIRNIPFVILGGIIVYLYFTTRNENRTFRFIWLLVTLSFLFYIPVAVGASFVSLLGMLMLPKTVCYMVLIWVFMRYAIKSNEIK